MFERITPNSLETCRSYFITFDSMFVEKEDPYGTSMAGKVWHFSEEKLEYDPLHKSMQKTYKFYLDLHRSTERVFFILPRGSVSEFGAISAKAKNDKVKGYIDPSLTRYYEFVRLDMMDEEDLFQWVLCGRNEKMVGRL